MLFRSDNLLQLFSINYDFPTAWHQFTSAASDAARKLEIAIDKNHFPYWTKPIGMEDSLTATFCCIDWVKKRLTLATKTIAFTGDEINGWSLLVNNTNAEVFSFLKKNSKNKVYMAVAYTAKL